MARPIVLFILSSDRSGSTWLGYVLGSTPNAAFLGEFYRAWDDHLRVPCSWCSAHGRDSCEVLGDIQGQPASRAFEIALAQTRAQVLVDASKRIAWAERFLAPDRHFNPVLIHLIRDPRGWYASEKKRRPETGSQLIDQWIAENLEIRDFLQLNNVPATTVFYDEIAARAPQGFAELCVTLGISFAESALQYWLKPHHGFAANGASSPVLSGAPKAIDWMITGDDKFYREHANQSFVDDRWKTQLSEADELAIRDHPRIAAFLNLYDRLLVSGEICRLTREDRALHARLDGKFVRAPGDTPELEKIYMVRAGKRHWVTSMQFVEQVGTNSPQELQLLPDETLRKIPIGLPVRS